MWGFRRQAITILQDEKYGLLSNDIRDIISRMDEAARDAIISEAIEHYGIGEHS